MVRISKTIKDTILYMHQIDHTRPVEIARAVNLKINTVRRILDRYKKTGNLYHNGMDTETKRTKQINYAKSWNKRNKGKVLEYVRRSQDKRKRGLMIIHTIQEWDELKKYYSNLCLRCGMKKKLTRDHVIPISLGGTDHIDNIQPLCHSCNSSKHTKSTDYRPRFEKMRHGIYARVDL